LNQVTVTIRDTFTFTEAATEGNGISFSAGKKTGGLRYFNMEMPFCPMATTQAGASQ